MDPKRTEGDMVELLRRRYLPERRNGDEWAVLEHVRDAAGFDAKRTIDVLCVGLWPSRGLQIVGHEIKCSRADWLRELRDPAKAEAFHGVVDAWWLVAANSRIVQDGELPAGWGLMVPQVFRGKERLTVAVPAATKVVGARPEVFSRSFLAAVLKNAANQAQVTPVEIKNAVRSELAAQKTRLDAQQRFEVEEHERLRERVRVFERESGVDLGRWHGNDQAERVGKALRAVLAAENAPERARRHLEQLRDSAARIVEAAERELDRVDRPDVEEAIAF